MPKSAPVPRKKGKEKEGEGKKGRVEKKKDRTKRKRTTDTSPDTTPLTEDPPIPLRPTKKKKVKSDKLAKEKDEAQKAFAKDQETQKTDQAAQKKTTETRKKAPTPREPTGTRLTESQKARLTRDNRTIWIGLARGQTKNRTALFSHLDSFIRTQLKGIKGLDEITKVAASYITATFEDTASRDRGIVKIKGAVFRWQDTIVPVQCCPFGQTDSESDAIWHIPAPGYTALEVGTAVQSAFVAAGYHMPQFEGRKQQKQGIVDGTWVLKFGSTPTFIKRIKTEDGSPLLVTTDPKGACRLCSTAGHTSWDCKTPDAQLTLSTEEKHHLTCAAADFSLNGAEVGEQEEQEGSERSHLSDAE